MSISPVSSNAAASTATPPPPPVQTHEKPKPAKAPVDKVTISKKAVQLASDGDTAAKEIKENAAEKASETLRGRK